MALLWKKDEPIIRSALETDVYKILMLAYIYRYYQYLKVKWGFKNRKTAIKLATYVPIAALREQFKAVMALRFSDADIAYLKGWEMFDSEFLGALQSLRLSMPLIREVDGQLVIEVEGTWFETTLWEIYIMAIVAELYNRNAAKEAGISERDLFDLGNARLTEKIDFLKRHPELVVALFGLRRRGSGPWEDHMTERMLTEIPQNISGVSNVFLAKKCGVAPIGTNAHELAMVEYSVARHMGPQEVRNSPYEVLRKWEKLYAHKALIMLSDTFGTDAFLRDLPPDIAQNWRGHRQDSGDAIQVGEKIIADYVRRDINPTRKLILFTDGLDTQRMLKLYEHFVGRIQIGFGVGTNFTNDFGAVSALSIVMKLMEAAGNPTVKLSDNLEKAMGPDQEVAFAKERFGYRSTFAEKTVY